MSDGSQMSVGKSDVKQKSDVARKWVVVRKPDVTQLLQGLLRMRERYSTLLGLHELVVAVGRRCIY